MTSTLSIAASVLVENVFTGVCDLHEYLRHCSPGARLGKGAMLGFDRGVVGVATCCIRNVVPLRRLVGDCVQPRSEEPMTPERRSTRLVSNGKVDARLVDDQVLLFDRLSLITVICGRRYTHFTPTLFTPPPLKHQSSLRPGV